MLDLRSAKSVERERLLKYKIDYNRFISTSTRPHQANVDLIISNREDRDTNKIIFILLLHLMHSGNPYSMITIILSHYFPII